MFACNVKFKNTLYRVYGEIKLITRRISEMLVAIYSLNENHDLLI